jgi:hypothetical protein
MSSQGHIARSGDRAAAQQRGEDFLSATRIAALLQTPPRIVNIGLPAFADELRAAGIPVVQLDWAPPAIADPRIRALLAKLS